MLHHCADVFFCVDEKIDLAETRIRRGDSPTAVFAGLRRATLR